MHFFILFLLNNFLLLFVQLFNGLQNIKPAGHPLFQ